MSNEMQPSRGRQPELTPEPNRKTDIGSGNTGDASPSAVDWECPSCGSLITADKLSCPNDDTPNKDGVIPLELRFKVPHYELLRLLGIGGMGAVYEARNTTTGTRVAIKMLHVNLVTERIVMRFKQEAKATNKLRHPNIIRISVCDVTPDNVPYLVEDLVEGPSLKDILRKEGSLSTEVALSFILQICEGMAYAHDHQILHRDLKPSNILFSEENHHLSAKIADFGNAKFLGEDASNQLTRSGEVFGTPHYMSPEQTSAGKVDARSDIYSIGCIFYQLLTGAPPFAGKTIMETLYKHVNQAIPTLAEGSLGKTFPKELEEISAKLLAKNPEDRYASIRDLSKDLQAFQAHLRNPSDKQVPPRVAANSRKRSLVVAISSVTAIGFLLILLAVGVYQATNSSQKEQANQISANDAGLAGSSDLPRLSSVSSHEPDEANYQLISREELYRLLAHGRPNNSLVVRHSKITDESFALIAETTWIHYISLNDCSIQNQSLSRLARLMNLTSINLSFTDFNDIGAASLSQCQNLQSVNVGSTNLSDEGLANLAAIKSLRGLTITGTRVTDNGLVELAKCKNLQGLGLENVERITSHGIAALGKTRLTELNLNSTSIDNSGMVYLAEIDSLITIHLNRTKVTIDGIRELCRTSKHCKNIYLMNCSNLGQEDIQQLRTEFCGIRFISEEPEGQKEGEP